VVFGKLDLIGGPVPEAPSFIYNEINDEIALIGPVEQTVSSACDRKASPPKQTKRHRRKHHKHVAKPQHH
jgi:hypothetical protein